MSDRYQIKEYAMSVSIDPPQTDEEFKRVLLLARDPHVRVTITEEGARRFEHLLPADLKAQLARWKEQERIAEHHRRAHQAQGRLR